MFNTVEKHQKIVKGIMGFLVVAFTLWGIGGYLGSMSDDGYVAKIGSNKIYPRDIDNAMTDNPQPNQNKMQVLYGLINRQVLLNHIDDTNQSVTKTQLQDNIAKIPLFQKNGQFDLSLYKDFLQEKMLSAEDFQANVAKQILLKQDIDFFKNSYFTSRDFNQKFVEMLSRERNVSHIRLIKKTILQGLM